MGLGLPPRRQIYELIDRHLSMSWGGDFLESHNSYGIQKMFSKGNHQPHGIRSFSSISRGARPPPKVTTPQTDIGKRTERHTREPQNREIAETIAKTTRARPRQKFPQRASKASTHKSIRKPRPPERHARDARTTAIGAQQKSRVSFPPSPATRTEAPTARLPRAGVKPPGGKMRPSARPHQPIPNDPRPKKQPQKYSRNN